MRRLFGMVISVVLAAGCGSPQGSAEPTNESTSTSSTTSTSTSTTVVIADEPEVAMYFVRDETLAVVGRSLGSIDAETVGNALLAGPSEAEQAAGLRSLIPAGTRLLDVSVLGDTATVNLSSQFEAVGGTLAVSLAIAQVTYTLSQLPEVHSVRFRIDGEPRSMLTGEGVMVDPATRAQFASTVLPSIFLERPFEGAALTNPIVISGMTDAFEATVNYQVLSSDGTVLVEGMTMATCGTGCWGEFTARIDLPVGTTGPLTVRVFDYSEADGTTMLDLVEVHVG